MLNVGILRSQHSPCCCRPDVYYAIRGEGGSHRFLPICDQQLYDEPDCLEPVQKTSQRKQFHLSRIRHLSTYEHQKWWFYLKPSNLMLHGNKNPKNSSGRQVLNHYRILIIFQVVVVVGNGMETYYGYNKSRKSISVL